jgi:hypothetical protein
MYDRRSDRPATTSPAVIKSLRVTLLRSGNQRQQCCQRDKTIFKRCLHNSCLSVIYFLTDKAISFTFLAR